MDDVAYIAINATKKLVEVKVEFDYSISDAKTKETSRAELIASLVAQQVGTFMQLETSELQRLYLKTLREASRQS